MQKAEDNKGYLSQNFYTLCVNSNYKFISGPFAKIFLKLSIFKKAKLI